MAARWEPPGGYLGRMVEAKWEYLRAVRFAPALPAAQAPASPEESTTLAARLREARSAWAQVAGRTGGGFDGFRPALPVVAEVKRRSPSAGVIAREVNPVGRARDYLQAGAAAVSVLADTEFFGGSPQDVAAVAAFTGAPVLFKDIVVHPCQVWLAQACQARAVLLIAAALGPDGLAELCEATRLAGLDAVVEVHDERELEMALGVRAPIVGVNNRNLRTFEVDLSTARRLLPLIPPDRIRLAESGYRTPQEVAAALRGGADAVLVGEALMRAAAVAPFFDALAQELACAGLQQGEHPEVRAQQAGAGSRP